MYNAAVNQSLHNRGLDMTLAVEKVTLKVNSDVGYGMLYNKKNRSDIKKQKS